MIPEKNHSLDAVIANILKKRQVTQHSQCMLVAWSSEEVVLGGLKSVRHTVVLSLLKPRGQKFYVVCISISIGNQPSGGQPGQTFTTVMDVYLSRRS